MSKVRSRKGPMPEGAHRDLMSDRGHGQGQTGGTTALTRASSCTRMTSLGHVAAVEEVDPSTVVAVTHIPELTL